MDNSEIHNTRFGKFISIMIQCNLNENEKIKEILKILNLNLNPNSDKGISLSSLYLLFSNNETFDLNFITSSEFRNFINTLNKLEYIKIKKKFYNELTDDFLIYYNDNIEFLYAQYYI